jgi:hypothetical protein
MPITNVMKLDKKDIIDLLFLQKTKGDCNVPKHIYCYDCILGPTRTAYCSGDPSFYGQALSEDFKSITFETSNKLLKKVDPLLIFECQLLTL